MVQIKHVGEVRRIRQYCFVQAPPPFGFGANSCKFTLGPLALGKVDALDKNSSHRSLWITHGLVHEVYAAFFRQLTGLPQEEHTNISANVCFSSPIDGIKEYNKSLVYYLREGVPNRFSKNFPVPDELKVPIIGSLEHVVRAG
jgi:hypothetical protein